MIELPTRHWPLFLIATLASGLLVAQERQTTRRFGIDKPEDALRFVFDEPLLADNVLETCRQAALMEDKDRYEFLKKWVLPSETHSTLRLQADFSPKNPAPSSDRLFTTAKVNPTHHSGIVEAGGELVSPAIELIRVASDLGHLSELRTIVEGLRSESAEQEKAQAAMLTVIAIAEHNDQSADEHLRQLLTIATTHPGREPERDPEAVALWAARHVSSLQEAARDLAIVLHEDSRRDEMRRSERWKRQIAACRFLLDSNDPAATSVVTGGEFRRSADDVRRPIGIGTPTKIDKPARSWHPVSREISETRGAGYPVAVWSQQSGRATHIAGHDHDYLYYVSPLRGNFVVEGDLTTHGFRDIHLGIGSYWAGVTYDLISTVSADFRYDEPGRPLNPPMTRMMDTMRVRMEVRDGLRTTFVNGRKVYERPHTENSDPWLSLHTWWLTNGMASNLRILEQPEIPEEISLLTPDLAGWAAYFDESVGYTDAHWIARSIPGELGEVGDNPQELLSRKRQDRKDTYSESLLRYHRPMLEDGTIRYRFFYEPGESLVHPVLDRLCFLVNPEGIDLHWITDGRHDATGLGPDNISRELTHRENSGPLPLKEKAWNQLALTLEGDVVNIDLNDVRVFSRPLEPQNLRTFGLFHYADQTQVQVRDLRWKGNWPKTLEAPTAQELADTSLEKELGDRESLPGILQHNFSNGVPSHLFSFVGGDWEKNTQQLPDGLQVTRPGGEYVNYTILSPILLSGDFDIIAEFSDLKTDVIDGGEGNVQLSLKLDDERASELHFFRKRYVFEGAKSEEIIQPAIFEKRGNESQFTFLSAPAEESSSGRM